MKHEVRDAREYVGYKACGSQKCERHGVCRKREHVRHETHKVRHERHDSTYGEKNARHGTR